MIKRETCAGSSASGPSAHCLRGCGSEFCLKCDGWFGYLGSGPREFRVSGCTTTFHTGGNEFEQKFDCVEYEKTQDHYGQESEHHSANAAFGRAQIPGHIAPISFGLLEIFQCFLDAEKAKDIPGYPAAVGHNKLAECDIPATLRCENEQLVGRKCWPDLDDSVLRTRWVGMTPPEGSNGNPYPRARIHCHARGRDGVAAGGARSNRRCRTAFAALALIHFSWEDKSGQYSQVVEALLPRALSFSRSRKVGGGLPGQGPCSTGDPIAGLLSRGRERDLSGSQAIHPMPLPRSRTPAE